MEVINDNIENNIRNNYQKDENFKFKYVQIKRKNFKSNLKDHKIL
jgi:hypothetical protein